MLFEHEYECLRYLLNERYVPATLSSKETHFTDDEGRRITPD